jgi:hypothetical protein
VSTDRFRAEIERTLRRFGATGFAYAWSGTTVTVAFHLGGLTVRAAMPLPSPDAPELCRTPTGHRRTERQAKDAYEAECRRRWCSLAAVIKAKLVPVEGNISTIEREFLAPVVLPNGQTIGEWAGPQLARGEPFLSSISFSWSTAPWPQGEVIFSKVEGCGNARRRAPGRTAAKRPSRRPPRRAPRSRAGSGT